MTVWKGLVSVRARAAGRACIVKSSVQVVRSPLVLVTVSVIRLSALVTVRMVLTLATLSVTIAHPVIRNI